MSAARLIKTSCTVIRRLPDDDADEFGNEIPAEVKVKTVCAVQQRNTDEPDGHGELSDSRWLGYFLIEETLTTADVVLVPGQGRFEVVGKPWRAEEGHRSLWHIEARLRETAGAGDDE
jgi:hypothetical protein